MTKVNDNILTVPNALTLFRLLLVPIFFILLVFYHNDLAAFIVFLIAASTDFLDGLAARLLNQVSKLGQQLDPLVDRLLILLGVIGVFMVGRIALWILVVLVVRDLLLAIVTIYQEKYLDKRFEVIFLGKVTTVFIMIGFCLLILGAPEVPGLGLINAPFLPGWGQEPALLGTWFLYVGIILSVTSGCYYVARCIKYAKMQRNENRGDNKNREYNK
ncbi:MAG: CDP-alcohol phosphatidyltransferase family protein [Coriobacteriia bacterium]|nr:CDP-alcohol phosphatidyltransferase family protein [Coriobacteriia bacterium]